GAVVAGQDRAADGIVVFHGREVLRQPLVEVGSPRVAGPWPAEGHDTDMIAFLVCDGHAASLSLGSRGAPHVNQATVPAASRAARPMPMRLAMLTRWMSAVPPGCTATIPLRCCSSMKLSGEPHVSSLVSAAGPTASRIAPVIQSPVILRW